MVCPSCLNEKTRVSKTTNDIVVERYRKCPKCGYGFITIEGLMVDPNLQQKVQYSDEEIALLLKKRHTGKQKEMF